MGSSHTAAHVCRSLSPHRPVSPHGRAPAGRGWASVSPRLGPGTTNARVGGVAVPRAAGRGRPRRPGGPAEPADLPLFIAGRVQLLLSTPSPRVVPAPDSWSPRLGRGRGQERAGAAGAGPRAWGAAGGLAGMGWGLQRAGAAGAPGGRAWGARGGRCRGRGLQGRLGGRAWGARGGGYRGQGLQGDPGGTGGGQGAGAAVGGCRGRDLVGHEGAGGCNGGGGAAVGPGGRGPGGTDGGQGLQGAGPGGTGGGRGCNGGLQEGGTWGGTRGLGAAAGGPQ